MRRDRLSEKTQLMTIASYFSLQGNSSIVRLNDRISQFKTIQETEEGRRGEGKLGRKKRGEGSVLYHCVRQLKR